MKKDFNKLFASPKNRAMAYVLVFVVGAVLIEIIKHLTTGSTSALGAIMMITFVLIGGGFICERRALSRIASASTLFILEGIAMRFGHAMIPAAYLLALVVSISIIGAHPILHRQYKSSAKTVVFSIAIILTALVLSFAFFYVMIILDRMAIYK